jgi:hypothetical protein
MRLCALNISYLCYYPTTQVKFSGIEFTRDSKGFFYSRYDAPDRFKESGSSEASDGKGEQASEASEGFTKGSETQANANHQVCSV